MTCSKCGADKPLDQFVAPRLQCKSCRREYLRAYREASQDSERARKRRWASENRDRVRASAAASRERNAERIRDQRTQSAEANRARARAWREANPERSREAKSRYQKANRETANARNRAWRSRNPERQNEYAAKRRALVRAAPVVEVVRRKEIWDRDQGRCHICGRGCDPNAWHLDHLVPLSRGGEHSARNVAVAHPRCNVSRGNRLLDGYGADDHLEGVVQSNMLAVLDAVIAARGG